MNRRVETREQQGSRGASQRVRVPDRKSAEVALAASAVLVMGGRAQAPRRTPKEGTLALLRARAL